MRTQKTNPEEKRSRYNKNMKARIILLNALPLNSFAIAKELTMRIRFYTYNEFVERIEDIKRLYKSLNINIECENFIRHAATKSTLSEILTSLSCADKQVYSYVPGDFIFIITLKQAVRGQEVSEITTNDLLFAELELIR